MKKLFYLSMSFLLLSLGCFTTSSPSLYGDGYFDERYREFIGDDHVVKSHYTYVMSYSDDGVFTKRTFYPDNKRMLSETHYKGVKFKVLSGPAKYWDETTGHLTSEGNYKKNKKEGIWKFYGDGQLSSEGSYVKGNKVGIWKNFKDGQLESTFSYEDDIKSGNFIQYDSLGNVLNQGVYQADTIFEQTNPQPAPVLTVDVMPSLIPCPEPVAGANRLDRCTEKLLLNSIYKAINYPREAREYGVQGRAIVQFVIGKDGSIGDVKVLRGLCDPIKDELIQLFEELDQRLEFRPGMRDGKKSRVQYILPIKFQLD